MFMRKDCFSSMEIVEILFADAFHPVTSGSSTPQDKRNQEERVALAACLEFLGPCWTVQEQVTSLGEGVHSEGEGIAP